MALTTHVIHFFKPVRISEWKLWALVICLFIMPLQVSAKTNLEAVAAKVKGKVFVKEPLSYKWKLINSQQAIPIESLIQVKEGSLLVLEGVISLENMKDKKFRVALKRPILFRVNNNLIRKVHISKIASQTILDTNDQIDKPFAISTAWKRVIAEFGKIKASFNKLNNDQEETKTSVDSSIQSSINILNNLDGRTINVQKTPSTFELSWKTENIPTETKYEVFFWDLAREKPKKGIQTDKNMLTLPVAKPGTYGVEITSADKKYRSKTIDLNFEEALFELEENKLNGKQIVINLNYPQNNETIFETHNPIYFMWTIYERDKFDTIGLFIESSESSFSYKKVVTKSFQKVTLFSGTYTWWVEAYRSGKSIWRSKNRSLKVKKASNFAQYIENLDFNNNQTVRFDH